MPGILANHVKITGIDDDTTKAITIKDLLTDQVSLAGVFFLHDLAAGITANRFFARRSMRPVKASVDVIVLILHMNIREEHSGKLYALNQAAYRRLAGDASNVTAMLTKYDRAILCSKLCDLVLSVPHG